MLGLSKKDDRKQKKMIEEILVSEVMPIVDFDEEIQAFVLEGGTYADFFQINCKDLQTAADEEIEYDNMCWDKLYKIYPGDLKMISFNFPTDTSLERDYTRHIINRTENPIFLEFLDERLAELKWIHTNRTDREHCLFFYGEDEDKLRDNSITIFSILSKGTNPLVKKVDKEKKMKIAFKLFNKNTALVGG